MRLLPALLVLAVVAAAMPADAQPPTFTQAYQLRGAVGDIPTTNATEPAGAWNLEQRLTVAHDNSTERQYGFQIPAGATLVNATCTCNPSQSRIMAASVVFTLPTTLASGSYVLTVTTTQAAGDAFAFHLDLPIEAGPEDRVAILYMPRDSTYDAPSQPFRTLPANSTDATIVWFTDVPSPFWLAVHPESAVTAGDDGDDAMWREWLLPVVVGLLVGMVVWSLLVSKGVVQTKSRRQVANTAAHVEAAAHDPPAVLEGKKRALLAALKEIEVARMNNQMAPEVYDQVKADLKKQAVTVMRALESSGAADESKA